MNKLEPINISLFVEDEETIYTTLSPVDELSWQVKAYINSKVFIYDTKQNINLTVISHKPLDEDRFRSAVSVWLKEEKAALDVKMSETNRIFIGTLAMGSIFLMLNIFLQGLNDLIKYSILPIMSSLSLGNAVRIMLIERPILKAKIKMLERLKETSVITFKTI